MPKGKGVRNVADRLVGWLLYGHETFSDVGHVLLPFGPTYASCDIPKRWNIFMRRYCFPILGIRCLDSIVNDPGGMGVVVTPSPTHWVFSTPSLDHLSQLYYP